MRLRRIFELKVDDIEKFERHIPDILANVEKLLYYRFRTALIADGIDDNLIEKYAVYAYFFDFGKTNIESDNAEYFGYDLDKERIRGSSECDANIEDFASHIIKNLKKNDILKQSVHTPLPSHQSIFKT